MPNHVAPDHPWPTSRPDCFCPAPRRSSREQPEAFLRTAGGIVARGRDPYFPPWPDVVQLNAFAPELRDGVAETLVDIAGQCDGLRCDMAMLMTNEVFARTWGDRAGRAGGGVLAGAHRARQARRTPTCVFIAEAYWDMEWTLQQQGFDSATTSASTTGSRTRPPRRCAGTSQADAGYQERLIRFIENHDEPRAAATFGPRGRAPPPS